MASVYTCMQMKYLLHYVVDLDPETWCTKRTKMLPWCSTYTQVLGLLHHLGKIKASINIYKHLIIPHKKLNDVNMWTREISFRLNLAINSRGV